MKPIALGMNAGRDRAARSSGAAGANDPGQNGEHEQNDQHDPAKRPPSPSTAAHDRRSFKCRTGRQLEGRRHCGSRRAWWHFERRFDPVLEPSCLLIGARPGKCHCLTPHMAAIGAAYGAGRPAPQLAFIDPISGPASRAADNHRAGAPRGCRLMRRREIVRDGQARANGSRRHRTSCRSSSRA